MTERSAHYAREVNAEVREVDEKINHNESHDMIDGHTSFTPGPHTSYTAGKHATFAEHATACPPLTHLLCNRSETDATELHQSNSYSLASYTSAYTLLTHLSCIRASNSSA